MKLFWARYPFDFSIYKPFQARFASLKKMASYEPADVIHRIDWIVVGASFCHTPFNHLTSLFGRYPWNLFQRHLMGYWIFCVVHTAFWKWAGVSSINKWAYISKIKSLVNQCSCLCGWTVKESLPMIIQSQKSKIVFKTILWLWTQRAHMGRKTSEYDMFSSTNSWNRATDM